MYLGNVIFLLGLLLFVVDNMEKFLTNSDLHNISKAEIKVKLSLYLINLVPCHEAVLGEWRYSSTILTLALDGGVWLVSHPSNLLLEKYLLVSTG
jgi:hypothetical protein